MVPKLGLFLRPWELLHFPPVSPAGRRRDERKPLHAFRNFQQVGFVWVFWDFFWFFFPTGMFLVVVSLNWFGLDAPQSLGFDFLQGKMDWVSGGKKQ